MATIEVIGWKENHIGWTGWDNTARSELSKRLRSAIDGSPSDRKRTERLVSSRSPLVIRHIRPEHVESLRQILETMGADATVSLS